MLWTFRHHALECDGCGRWFHSRCGTGITAEEYRRAVINDEEIDWPGCKDCQVSYNIMEVRFTSFHLQILTSFFLYFRSETLLTLKEIGNEPVPSLPKPEQMARCANRLRQQLRPKDPLGLGFRIGGRASPC